MSKRTRIACLWLGVLLLAISGGCNRQTKKRIAVIPKGQAHIFWQSVHAGAVAASREFNVEIIWNGPAGETDYTQQLQIVDAMITQHVDAICLAPIDKTSMVSVVERAAKQNIPVIIWDSGIDTENFVSQVATDNYLAGQMAAERIGKILNGKGKVAIVAVMPGAASTMAREQGFEDAVKKNLPGIQIVDKRYGWADRAKSLAVAENMLTAYADLDAMFASNESSAVGAAQALKSRNSKVRLVGFDSSPNLLDDLKSGAIDSLVVQDPFKMGYESVKAAVEKLNGGTPKKINNLTPLVVTRENMSDPAVDSRLHPDLDKYLK
ncbi:MAG: substrate-binding domain-containing protein [Candidatus Solibacter usitatus]|nr:substrate-binding domain-containing protein [Candidatus Solibacter usitatus]